MSTFVAEQVCRIDGQFDRLQLSDTADHEADAQETPYEHHSSAQKRTSPEILRIQELQRLVQSVSTTYTPSAPLASSDRIRSALKGLGTNDVDDLQTSEEKEYVDELRWLLLSKATTQVYGRVLNTILDQTLILNDHIWYWDEVLGSSRYATLYSLQTSPLRLWKTTKVVAHRVRSRGGMNAGWQQFYHIVEDVVQGLSIEKMRSSVLSPMAKVHTEVRSKQKQLRRLRDVDALSLGVLLDVGQPHKRVPDRPNGDATTAEAVYLQKRKLKGSVAKSVSLMEAVLVNAKDSGKQLHVDSFKDELAASTSSDFHYNYEQRSGEPEDEDIGVEEVGLRLSAILDSILPQYKAAFDQRLAHNGRPSRLIRYWLPAAALLLSSSTILRIFVKRKADIVTWIRELGGTIMDFWSNWVVEPTKKLIGTIRHDESSEVAIMSKRSLEGDRESLERMVVDFAVQHPENGSLSAADIADIRAKVREGDLTPVLKAYEKDMASPFMGVLKGNLVRTLLIQVQKTKVDVEVAMGGIDAMLKSQELLFGLIGVTPGILISVAALRWFGGVFGNRRFRNEGSKKGQLLTVMRRIDRILTNAVPSDELLSYKDYGLVLIDAHQLRQLAHDMLPRHVFREFKIDLDELTDIQNGPTRQREALSRMRWGFSRWM